MNMEWVLEAVYFYFYFPSFDLREDHWHGSMYCTIDDLSNSTSK